VLSACGDDEPSDEATTASTAAPASDATATEDGPTSAQPTTSGTDPETTPAPPTSAEAAVTWQQVSFEGGPAPRSSAALVAAPDGTLWLHGGQVGGSASAELWRFDGSAWEQVAVEGVAPSARFEHVGVWDSVRDRLVIALGQEDDASVRDDVWAFDPAAGTWEELATGSGPAARYGSCGVVTDNTLVVTHGFSAVQRFDDTWAFDLAAGTWSERSPSEGPRPTARCLHSCALDDSGALVIFGGRTNQARFVGDTWRLTDAGWEEVATEGPSPRARSRAAAIEGVMHMLGGETESGPAGDAWQLTDTGWVAGPEGAPAARYAHAIAQGDDTVWVFGGTDASGAPLGDLWQLG